MNISTPKVSFLLNLIIFTQMIDYGTNCGTQTISSPTHLLELRIYVKLDTPLFTIKNGISAVSVVNIMMEHSRIEPLTSTLPAMRSPTIVCFTPHKSETN
jgi:hypothetical protein